MPLEKVQHIEGLDSYQNVELLDDTDPGAMIVGFSVVSEEIPSETQKTGKIVRKNFVYITVTWEVGHTSFSRRIYDEVEFDESTQKWRVIRLAPEKQSDILKHPAEWNAFALGTPLQDVGTPLSILFPTDPSRVLMYKDKHITTVERLAGVNQTDASLMGMGVFDDVQRAQQHLTKMNKLVSSSALSTRLDELASENEKLRRQVEEMSKIKEGAPRRGRPPKNKIEEEAFIP